MFVGQNLIQPVLWEFEFCDVQINNYKNNGDKLFKVLKLLSLLI